MTLETRMTRLSADEILLVTAWRGLKPDERAIVATAIRALASPAQEQDREERRNT